MARDYTKYTVAGLGENLNKRQLVLTIVKDWANKNNPTLDEIQKVFTDKIQGSKGFIVKESEVNDAKRFNMQEPLSIKNGTKVVVSNQWGENIVDFIAGAEKLGYKISTEENLNEVSDSQDGPSKEILIEIGGRMSTYMFGVLQDEYYLECKDALEYSSDTIHSIGAFVKILYGTTIEDGAKNGIDVFKKNMDMDKFNSNCPLLAEFVSDVENGDASYYDFYDYIIDVSSEQVHLFEDDALITIYEDNEVIHSEVSLKDFLGETEAIWLEDEPKAEATATSLWTKNSKKFNLVIDALEHAEAKKANNGVLLLSAWFEPESLKEYQITERNVTVEHDYEVYFSFSFEATNFNLSKLAFLKFANATQFHKSGPENIGSYLSYDGVIISPELNISEENELTLEYEGQKSCNYFLFG
jgi:hypothetical protein|tara:strand:+ start:10 stop:1248 length:1239 start_codon:yes stop_codon:yes gene_type:complete